MKRLTQIALMGTLISIVGHLYLTLHYYPLKFGFAAGQSICNLNAKFDCDAVSASAYSALFGIPLSAWGIAFNLILFLLILLSWLEWNENPERVRRWTLVLAGGSLLASVVMGTISLALMNNYCLFCIGLYVLSAIVFFAFKGTLREPFLMHFKRDLPVLWSESRSLIFTTAAIPVIAFMIHQAFTNNMGAQQLGRLVKDSVNEWNVNPAHELVAKPALSMGPERERATLTLAEFADFRCGHCKRASYSLHAFVKAHPDVRFEFYNFPLDGACNDRINQKSGVNCRMAAAVVCAEREGRGWEMHDLIFAKQEEMYSIGTTTALDNEFAKLVPGLGLNWESLQRCLDSQDTLEAVRNQAKQGALVNVNGTPTVFANGRLLNRGQLVPVLQAVHARAQEARR